MAGRGWLTLNSPSSMGTLLCKIHPLCLQLFFKFSFRSPSTSDADVVWHSMYLVLGVNVLLSRLLLQLCELGEGVEHGQRVLAGVPSDQHSERQRAMQVFQDWNCPVGHQLGQLGVHRMVRSDPPPTCSLILSKLLRFFIK